MINSSYIRIRIILLKIKYLFIFNQEIDEY